MSEAITRADLLAVAAQLYREGERIGPHADAEPFFAFARVIRGALAAPAPDAVPELPEWVSDLGTGYYNVSLPSVDVFVTEIDEPAWFGAICSATARSAGPAAPGSHGKGSALT